MIESALMPDRHAKSTRLQSRPDRMPDPDVFLPFDHTDLIWRLLRKLRGRFDGRPNRECQVANSVRPVCRAAPPAAQVH